jgi:hypothetical protein
MRKRDFLAAGLGLGVGLGALAAQAQQAPAAAPAGRRNPPPVPNRRVKTTPLFKSPDGYPNAIAASAEGLWIAEQLTITDPPSGKTNTVYLVDWNGKVLKSVRNDSRNTSGMGFGGGYLWIAANAEPEGIFQTSLDGKTVSHRQIPLGPPSNGGGCHGCMYHEGKLYINALRLRGILRVDAKTWQPEFLIPYQFDRTHELAWDNGAIWMITGTRGKTAAEDFGGLAKFDAATGRLLETASFDIGAADPHGLTMHNGVLYSCDAAIHPGWKDSSSPTSGMIFRIDFV